MKGQLTLPMALLLIVSILLVLFVVFIFLNFVPFGSLTQKFIIYSVSSNSTETTIVSNFDLNSVSNITLVSSIATNYIYSPTKFLSQNSTDTEYNIVFSTPTPAITITGSYAYLQNGVKVPIEIINNQVKTTSALSTLYLIVTSSSYLPATNSTTTINATTNINNPQFYYSVNQQRVLSCSSSVQTCTVPINYVSGTELFIKVTAFNLTYSSGITKTIIIFVK